MNILCIGQSTLDISLPLDQDLIENEKFRVYDKLESAGGPATTASILLGLWGEDVSLLSRLGDDLYGHYISNILFKAGVKHHPIPCVGFSTPISVILTNKSNGKRTIFNCPGNIALSDLCVKEDVNVMLTDAHEPEITQRFLTQHPNTISVLDAGGYRPNTVEVAKRVTWLVSSETFASGYSGVTIDLNDPKTWNSMYERLHELNPHPIVTLGERGCLYEENGEIHHLSAFPAIAIDTNGAGDIFHGAFVYALSHKYNLREALRLASMTSSISVTRRGGSLSIPTLDEVLSALQHV
ncbi:MAG: Sugar kinase ribokinase family [Erysipelotrichaceae bacterium]|nr:MAG: Sugar kinase ribokinase [Erysipelotrichaceae bacterium]TXT19492.1 MAG: Sugar kinase ribokinase family [Erysipelotrichaceae bacterium]